MFINHPVRFFLSAHVRVKFIVLLPLETCPSGVWCCYCFWLCFQFVCCDLFALCYYKIALVRANDEDDEVSPEEEVTFDDTPDATVPDDEELVDENGNTRVHDGSAKAEVSYLFPDSSIRRMSLVEWVGFMVRFCYWRSNHYFDWTYEQRFSKLERVFCRRIFAFTSRRKNVHSKCINFEIFILNCSILVVNTTY